MYPTLCLSKNPASSPTPLHLDLPLTSMINNWIFLETLPWRGMSSTTTENFLWLSTVVKYQYGSQILELFSIDQICYFSCFEMQTLCDWDLGGVLFTGMHLCLVSGRHWLFIEWINAFDWVESAWLLLLERHQPHSPGWVSGSSIFALMTGAWGAPSCWCFQQLYRVSILLSVASHPHPSKPKVH